MAKTSLSPMCSATSQLHYMKGGNVADWEGCHCPTQNVGTMNYEERNGGPRDKNENASRQSSSVAVVSERAGARHTCPDEDDSGGNAGRESGKSISGGLSKLILACPDHIP